MNKKLKDNKEKAELLNQNEDDSNQLVQLKYLERNGTKYLILSELMRLRSIVDSKELLFLDTFYNLAFQANLYGSYFNLNSVQYSRFTKHEKKTFYFLNQSLYNTLREQEDKDQDQNLNVDQMIELQQMIEDYKRQIYDEALIVENFWSILSKEDCEPNDLMKIGITLVQNYLTCRNTFRSILEIKPDTREAVYLNIQFLQDVMNFEIESRDGITMLKNIDQKQAILKRNSNYINHDKKGIVIMSYNSNNKGKIIYSNEIICQVLGFSQRQLQGQLIDLIIPQVLRQLHQIKIQNFLHSINLKKTVSHFEKVWALKANQSIVPLSSTIRMSTTCKQGLVFIGIFDKLTEIQTQSFSQKIEQCFIMLTDEYDNIAYVSETFQTFFPKITDEIKNQFKLKVEFLFKDLETFSEEELEKGVLVNLQPNARNHRDFTNLLQNYTSDQFNLSIVQHSWLKESHSLKEIIFAKDTEREIFRSNKETANFPFNGTDRSSFIGVNEVQLINEDSMKEEDFQFGGDFSSQSSNSTSNSKVLLNQKQAINLDEMPITLQNLKKAIICYFLVLILTSFSILAITELSFAEFSQLGVSIESSAIMFGTTPKVKLAFLMQMQVINNKTKLNVSKEEAYTQMNTQLNYYYDQLRDGFNEMINADVSINNQLSTFLSSKNVALYELSNSNDQLLVHYQTYHIGFLEYLNKFQKFINLTYEQFDHYFSNFNLLKPQLFTNSFEQDAYYLIYNGNKDIDDVTYTVGALFVKNAQEKLQTYLNAFLSITVVCIIITIFVTLLLIPITFSMDVEQEKNISNLLLVSSSTKLNVGKRLNQFLKQLDSQMKVEKVKNAQEEYLSLSQYEVQSNEQDSSSPTSKSNILTRKSPIIEIQITINSFEILKQHEVIFTTKNYNSSTKKQIQDICGEELSDLIMKCDKKIKRIYKEMRIEHLQQPKTKFIKNLTKQGSTLSKSKNIYKITINPHTKDSFINVQECLQSNREEEQKDWSYIKRNEDSTLKEESISQTKSIKIEEEKIPKKEKIKMIEDTDKKQNLVRIFFMKRKAEKSILIISFSSLIIAFYIAQIFASRYIYGLAEANLNQTIYTNKSTISSQDYLQNYCNNIFTTYDDRIKNPPPQLKDAIPSILQLNREEFCSIIDLPEGEDSSSCEIQQDGILLKGYKQSIEAVYYYVYNFFFLFDSTPPYKRDQQLLDSIAYAPSHYQYASTILKYLLSGWATIDEIYDSNLQAFSQKQIQVCSVAFALFVLLLIVSTFISIKVIIKNLLNVTIRSKIMLKVIPNDELKVLQEMKMKKERNY